MTSDASGGRSTKSWPYAEWPDALRGGPDLAAIAGMRRSLAIAAVMAMLGLAVFTPRAAAFELSGCNLILQSFDADGEPLDTAVGDAQGGEGGTQEDPLLVDYDGTVRWEGDTGDQLITNAEWSVDVFLVPTPLRGTDPNEEQETAREGEIDVRASLPIRASGLVFVSGRVEGEGGSCRGHGWFRILAEPQETPATIPFWIALLIIGAGLLALWAARPSVVLPPGYREVRS